MKITIVGVGALGSHLVQFLRNEKADIYVIDFDRVEQKNVLSQFHSRTGVGKLKTRSLQEAMNFLYARPITTNVNKLTSSNVNVLLQHSDLIVDCLDNAETRKLVQHHARVSVIPCLHGALAPGGEFGRVIWDKDFYIDSEVGVGGATCEDGAFLPFIGITAAYLARAVQIFLATGKQTGFSISPAGAFSI